MVKYETSAKKYVSPDLLVSLYQQGLSERQISNRLREDKVYLSKAGVHKRLVKLRLRFPELKRIADQKKQKIFSQVRPALMKFLICCRNCRSTKKLCDALGKKGKERTLRRYLKSLRDPRLVRPRKQPRIDKRQMRRRLAFARSFLEKSFDWRPLTSATKRCSVWMGRGIAQNYWHTERRKCLRCLVGDVINMVCSFLGASLLAVRLRWLCLV